MSTWVCIGSGPSLTQADCDLVAQFPKIVVNNSYQLASGILYAGDIAWWDKHHAAVKKEAPVNGVARKCYTRSPNASRKYDLNLFVGLPGKYNSGQKAIELAAHLGATQILLLGYDCSVAKGVHWHGAHQDLRNPGPKSVVSWHGEFGEMIRKVKLPPVINCSRFSELPYFPKINLEEMLAREALSAA